MSRKYDLANILLEASYGGITRVYCLKFGKITVGFLVGPTQGLSPPKKKESWESNTLTGEILLEAN